MAATREPTPRKAAPRKAPPRKATGPVVGTIKGGQDDGRETVMLPVSTLSVVFKKPSPGQVAALRRSATLFGSSDQKVQAQGGLLFLDVLDALVSDAAILNRLYRGLADESIPLEDYADAAVALLQHYGDEEEGQAPKNGPVATRRARAR